jgi:hypothetical protein
MSVNNRLIEAQQARFDARIKELNLIKESNFATARIQRQILTGMNELVIALKENTQQTKPYNIHASPIPKPDDFIEDDSRTKSGSTG